MQIRVRVKSKENVTEGGIVPSKENVTEADSLLSRAKQNTLSNVARRSRSFPESCQQAIDLFAQRHGFGLLVERLQTSLLLLSQHPSSDQALIGRLSLIPMTKHLIP